MHNETNNRNSTNLTLNDDNDDDDDGGVCSEDDEIEAILQITPSNCFKSSDIDEPNLEVEADQNQDKNNSCKKETNDDQNKRKVRFTAHQKYELEKLFNTKNYISRTQCDELAIKLDLTQVQIRDWFKNHRKQLKRTQNIQFKKVN
jgi:hypothetical protein